LTLTENKSASTGPIALPQSMKAVVNYGPRDYRLEEVAVPEVGPDDILIKVESCGVCASDIKCYEGASMFWGGNGSPAYVKGPVIPGHEFIGHVAKLGERAARTRNLQVGERVIAEQIVPCWQCRYCQRGQYWMCQVHDIFGFQNNVNGGWAQFMKFPAASLIHKVPNDIPERLAVLIEPLSCSIHAVERGKIEFGDVVVLAGAGPLGLGMIGAAKRKTPSKLIVLDMNDKRLALAKLFGADIVMNPAKEDVIGKVLELTDGYGCDVYIESTGHPASVGQGLAMIRKLGRFVEFSVFNQPASVDWSIIGDRKELDIYGAHLGPYAYPKAIEFLDKELISMQGVVTHVLPLEEFQQALDMVHEGQESIKVVLKPD
jgi:2-desacetyl-2-hydroxyethyl bacteriochlorophyllide A dehydrogenase